MAPRKIEDLNAVIKKVQPLESKILSRVPAILTLVGHTGSGKSYLAVSMIKMMLKEKSLTHVFIVSPTANSNTIYKHIFDAERGDKIYSDIGPAVFNSLLDVQKTCEGIGKAYEEDLKYAIAYQKYITGEMVNHQDEHMLDTRGFKKVTPVRPSFCLFCDDCQGSSLFSKNAKNPFPNLVLRSRHVANGLGLTIVMAAQSMKNGVPRSLRLNSTHWVLFRSMSASEQADMYDQVAAFTSKSEFDRLFELWTSPKHGYMFADLITHNLSSTF